MLTHKHAGSHKNEHPSTHKYTHLRARTRTELPFSENAHARAHVYTHKNHMSTPRDTHEHTVIHSMSIHSCCDKDTNASSLEALAMDSRSWWSRRRLWSIEWRESWKRDRDEEMVLAAVQEEVLSESKEKTQSAQRWPTRRMGRRSRRRGAVAEWRLGFEVLLQSAGVRDRLYGQGSRI